MKIHFCGESQEVTGSCFLLETEESRILVDCGMFQGSKILKELNYGEFPFEPNTIDAMILTHAHVDHSGMIPKLVKKGFRGPIYATRETKDFCTVLLPDSGYIQEMEIERKNRKRMRAGLPPLEPIYLAQDASDAMRQFEAVDYRSPFALTPSIQAEFFDGGHILGSAHVLLTIQEGGGKSKKILFSGDIGNYNQPFIKDPSQIDRADILVMESTYGNRVHENIDHRIDILADIINEAYETGGKIIIPAFAVERTQDVLHYLQKLQKDKRIPVIPIYIDSPLAIAATKVFERNTENFDAETQALIEAGHNPLQMENLHFSQTMEESIMLNSLEGRAIIISASGMADAGRIKHHLKHNLWRPEATVVFTGFQAEETLGRRLLEGEKEVRIHGEMVAVKARIRQMQGFSAHADQNQLLHWMEKLAPQVERIILVHGEADAMKEFSHLVEDKWGKAVLCPELGEVMRFTSTGVERTKPEKPWLETMAQQLAEIKAWEEKFKLQEEGEEKAAAPVVRKAPKQPRPTTQEVDESYAALRSSIKSFTDRCRRERDYQHLMDTYRKITALLEKADH